MTRRFHVCNGDADGLCAVQQWRCRASGGVDLDVAAELILARNRTHCRPPLPDAEVTRVVESIGHLHEADAGPPG